MAVRLTIRRKLFLAFLGVVAVPVAMLGSLSRSYIHTARGELDRRFTEQSTGAFKRLQDDMYAGLGRIQDAAARLAAEPALRRPLAPLPALPGGPPRVPPPSPIGHLAQEFLRQHPEAIGLKIEGRIGESAPEPHEIEQRLGVSLGQALERLKVEKGEPQEALQMLLARGLRALRRSGEQGDAEPQRVRIAKLLKEHSDAIVLEIESAEAETVFSNLRDESASTRQHLRLAMQDYFRRSAHDRGNLPPVWFLEPDGRYRVFVQAPVRGPRGAIDGLLFVEVDPRRLLRPERILDSGWAFVLEEKEGKITPRHAPDDAQILRAVVPPAELLRSMEREHHSMGSFTGPDDTRYRVYAQLAPDFMVAVAPEREVFAALFGFRLQVFLVIAVSMLLAVGLAYHYSGRFVGAVENIRQGVAAISRGEWHHLEKSSHDELGGELVESVNRMALSLAERQRREEIQNWRRLVRVLSHEINNTLGPVRSVAATIADRIAPRVKDQDAGEDLRMASRLIVERVDALSGFISGYADLAKLPDPQRERIEFNQLVKSAVQMFTEEAEKRQIGVQQSYDTRIDGALLDPRQIERVVINLVKNALEAAPGQGKGEVLVRTYRPGRGRVELTVEDNGPGIAPEAQRNLFVPYFTTKPGGTGIGLALVRQIVLGHGGVVTAEERPGGGTVMRVVLPAAGGEIA